MVTCALVESGTFVAMEPCAPPTRTATCASVQIGPMVLETSVQVETATCASLQCVAEEQGAMETLAEEQGEIDCELAHEAGDQHSLHVPSPSSPAHCASPPLHSLAVEDICHHSDASPLPCPHQLQLAEARAAWQSSPG